MSVKAKRAQATIEYLLLSAVSLSLVAFSLLALSHIRDSMDGAYASAAFKSSASGLAVAIDEACALGDGNVRTVYVERAVVVSGGAADGGHYAEFHDEENGNLSFVEQVHCPVADANAVSGKVEVRNEGGTVSFYH